MGSLLWSKSSTQSLLPESRDARIRVSLILATLKIPHPGLLDKALMATLSAIFGHIICDIRWGFTHRSTPFQRLPPYALENLIKHRPGSVFARVRLLTWLRCTLSLISLSA